MTRSVGRARLSLAIALTSWLGGPGGPGVASLEAQQAGAQVVLYGRVTDAGSTVPIADAEVELQGVETVTTDRQGLFYFGAVPAGTFTIRVRRLGFGAFESQIELTPPSVSLRISVTEEAIELDPVVVAVPRAHEAARRSSGTSSNRVTREEILEAQGTGANLADVLANNVTGLTIRGRGTGSVCLEFRAPRAGDRNECRNPVVVMDGVRLANPRAVFASMPLEQIQNMEVIPPGAAGVAYGTDSSYGVLLITTRTAADIMGPERLAASGAPASPRVYDWSLEGRRYRWEKVFAASALANAMGVLAGVAVGRNCLPFDDLSAHLFESTCGSFATVMGRTLLIGAPLMGTTLGVRWAGDTDLSRGRIAPALLGAAIIGVPGYVMAVSGPQDAFDGADWVGRAFILVGMPAFATLADRLFRNVREPDDPT